MSYILKVGVAVFMTREIEQILLVVEQVFKAFDLPVVITSGVDGPHRENSLHGCFRAIDVRIHFFPDIEQSFSWEKNYEYILTAMKQMYKNKDLPVVVLLEEDHLHIEWIGKNP